MSGPRTACALYDYLPRISVTGDIVKRAGTGLKPRVLDDYELLLFPDATRSLYVLEGKAYSLGQTSFVVTRPGELHEYIYDPVQPSRHLFLHFRFIEGANAPPLSILQPGGTPCVATDDELLTGMMKQILHVSYSNPEATQRRGSMLLMSLLEELDGMAAETPPPRDQNRMPPQIAKALELIETHLAKPLTVQELANEVGWTHEHLSRSFVRYTGRSPRDTIIHRRIERACLMLQYGSGSIKEIAYAVGFADENYFYRVFKQVKGMTSAEYRRKYFNPWYAELHPVSDGDSPYPVNRILYQAPPASIGIRSIAPYHENGKDDCDDRN